MTRMIRVMTMAATACLVLLGQGITSHGWADEEPTKDVVSPVDPAKSGETPSSDKKKLEAQVTTAPEGTPGTYPIGTSTGEIGSGGLVSGAEGGFGGGGNGLPGGLKAKIGGKIKPKAKPKHLEEQKKIIQKGIKEKIEEIRACYEKDLKNDTTSGGKVVVTFTIETTGKVSSASIKESTLPSEVTTACLVEVVETMYFPERQGMPSTVINYPFIFKTPDGD